MQEMDIETETSELLHFVFCPGQPG